MDFSDTPEEAVFRAEARAWLQAHAPGHLLPEGARPEDGKLVRRARAWLRQLAAGNYAGILLPQSLGGRGGTIAEAMIFAEEEGHYRLPKGPYTLIGQGMALPAIIKHGTPEQIARFVAPTLRGDLIWCQLFSEPGAGSDLAALRTRAVRDGDDWVVNGQKIWSSWAHQADWGILVARTDPAVPKHKGLSFFVVDMKTPGIEVRPIRQISGASDFNETFFTDLRIPDHCRIGQIGEGWACAMTVLTSERLNQGGDTESGIDNLIRYAARTVREEGSPFDSSAVRLRFAMAHAEEQAERYLQYRLRTMVSKGEDPGALPAIVKLAFGGRFQKMSAFALELRDLAGLAHDPGDTDTAAIMSDYIWSIALRIAGGADEVLRNQLAERVLGMPGEPRIDKDVPFNKLP
jgi:alkylation response protein AidB-like acyl-CoA dehydrogenase